MRYLTSPDEMRRIEARYKRETDASEDALMERAAKAAADTLMARLPLYKAKAVVFACGPGNNGGDGYAAARLYAEMGGRAVVLPMTETGALRGAARINAERARTTAGVFFADPARLDKMPTPGAWVDALFGIGLSKNIEEPYASVISRMNADHARGALVMSVDIPSGVEGGSGNVLGCAVEADVTVTFHAAKYGHYFGRGMDLPAKFACTALAFRRHTCRKMLRGCCQRRICAACFRGGRGRRTRGIMVIC